MARDTPEQLAASLDRLGRRLSGNVEKLMGRVIRDIAKELIPDTPVDTGFARANWRPSINAPAVSPITRTDPVGNATIRSISGLSRLWKVGDVFYIANNIDYIGNLNAGSSPQAPAGFVRMAIDSGIKKAFSPDPKLLK